MTYTGERNRKDLGISRKFTKGSIHENASGRFLIMDRFKDENGVIMLEFQWVSGQHEGIIDTNKEMNVNASIHKFNVARGITPQVEYTSKVEPFVEKIDKILEILEDREDELAKIDVIHNLIQVNNAWIEKFENILEDRVRINEEQQKTIEQLVHQVERMSEKNLALINQQNLMEKILDTIGGQKR